MPLFEYRCDACGKKFSLLVGMTAEKAKLECPKCGGRKVTKLISRIARTPKSEDFDDLGDDLGGEDADADYGDDLADDTDDE
jgi:putative FmdB family regulatory protein